MAEQQEKEYRRSHGLRDFSRCGKTWQQLTLKGLGLYFSFFFILLSFSLFLFFILINNPENKSILKKNKVKKPGKSLSPQINKFH